MPINKGNKSGWECLCVVVQVCVCMHASAAWNIEAYCKDNAKQWCLFFNGPVICVQISIIKYFSICYLVTSNLRVCLDVFFAHIVCAWDRYLNIITDDEVYSVTFKIMNKQTDSGWTHRQTADHKLTARTNLTCHFQSGQSDSAPVCSSYSAQQQESMSGFPGLQPEERIRRAGGMLPG